MRQIFCTFFATHEVESRTKVVQGQSCRNVKDDCGSRSTWIPQTDFNDTQKAKGRNSPAAVAVRLVITSHPTTRQPYNKNTLFFTVSTFSTTFMRHVSHVNPIFLRDWTCNNADTVSFLRRRIGAIVYRLGASLPFKLASSESACLTLTLKTTEESSLSSLHWIFL